MLDDQPLGRPVPPLTRSLGVMGVLFLTLSVATPASSVFVIVPGMLQVAGTGAIWAMVLAGIVCVATAFVYAELSSAWPAAGGEYVAVAQTLGPLAGFVMLGVNVFNNLFFPPVAGLGISAVLSTVWPGLPTVPVAVVVVTGATLIALLQIRVNAWVTGLFLLGEMLALAAIVALGLADRARPVGAMLLHPVMPSAAALVPASPAAIGLATSIAIFALNGYGAAVYFAEEMREPSRLIARAILASLVLTLVFEIAPTVALLVGAPDLHGAVTADDPFGLLARMRGGGWTADAIAIGVVIAIVNAIIACILACARFFYGTARDGSWGRPLDRWMAMIHPRLGSPWVGTLIVGGVGVACCFLPLTLLLVLSGTGLVAIYAGIAVAALVGRLNGATAHAAYRMPLFPLAPVATLIALGYVTWTSWLDPAEGRPGLIMTALQIAASAAYYVLVLRRRGDWRVHVPEVTDDRPERL
ncbi:APC family permease [Sphingomonas sp. MA1305]|uniref:APC family permease n=1 Tax=Sphingomonas sp. MA1305 TaxID=2479204 RepID=UPI001E40F37E|nr:APC family permease [Sphingomonas sp. MA1305]